MPDAASRPEPFIVQTAPAALEDLCARLRATRWPDEPEGVGWSLGTDPAYLRELVAYWADGFDWPALELRALFRPRRGNMTGQQILLGMLYTGAASMRRDERAIPRSSR